jgi:hypothetical protein
VDYYFSNPVLNHPWTPAGLARSDREKSPKKRVASGKANPSKSSVAPVATKNGKSKKLAREASRASEETVPPAHVQPLRGSELDVVREEMVLSARRLLGVKESFTPDSFLRHLLAVNNLDVPEAPEDGLVPWLAASRWAVAGQVSAVSPGDILFLGKPRAETAVVVDSVESDGRVVFIGYWNGLVQKGVLSLRHPGSRRDEASGTVWNTYVGKSQLAGGLVGGILPLAGTGELAGGAP